MAARVRWLGGGKTQRLTLIVLGALAVLAVASLVLFRGLGRWLDRLEQQVRDAEQRLVMAVAATQQAEQVQQAFSAYEPFASPSQPAAAERNQLLRDVEDALRQSGIVSLSSRELQTNEEAEGTVSIRVDGESSPGQLITFLDLLQRSPRLLRVTKLEVRVSEGRTLRCSMDVSKLLLQ